MDEDWKALAKEQITECIGFGIVRRRLQDPTCVYTKDANRVILMMISLSALPLTPKAFKAHPDVQKLVPDGKWGPCAQGAWDTLEKLASE